MEYDVLIVGGGPAGLSAALALGRARKRVIVCDEADARRNAAAMHLQNFVTRDGTPPLEFRAIARDQISRYPSVEFQASRVERIGGQQGAFAADLAGGRRVHARRVLLCTGLIDDLPAIPGFRELWGTSIFQCPYCHGWEVQGQRFAYWAASADTTDFALLLRGWSDDVVLLTGGAFALSDELRERLTRGGVSVDERIIERVEGDDGHLHAVVFTAGERLPRDAMFVHPPQRQVPIVQALGLATDGRGFIAVDESRRTSIAGVYAAGDLTTHAHAAVMAAGAGMHAAAVLNHDLTLERALAVAPD